MPQCSRVEEVPFLAPQRGPIGKCLNPTGSGQFRQDGEGHDQGERVATPTGLPPIPQRCGGGVACAAINQIRLVRFHKPKGQTALLHHNTFRSDGWVSYPHHTLKGVVLCPVHRNESSRRLCNRHNRLRDPLATRRESRYDRAVWPTHPARLSPQPNPNEVAMRFIDLSTTIAPSPPSTPDLIRVDLQHAPHAAGAATIQALFKVPPALLRDGEGWAVETFTRFGTHDSTHVDAPWHYNSTIQGQPAQTIDQLPLAWFFAPGVVLDIRHKADGDALTVAEAQDALTATGHALQPGDIVLVHTGRDAYYDQPDYMFRGPGVTAEATRWLFAQGVRVMGIDAWGWDAPLDRQARAALTQQTPGIFWAAHQVDLPYCQIERLMNLAALPPSGFTVACFPLKVQGGSAGPCRAVAILPD